MRAVIAESFERIHRSNLIGMGVLPLQFLPDESALGLGLTGRESFSLEGLDDLAPGARVRVSATAEQGSERAFYVLARVDTPIELEIYRHGGILHMVLRQILAGRA